MFYLGDMVSLNFVCQDNIIVGVSILSQSTTMFKRNRSNGSKIEQFL